MKRPTSTPSSNLSNGRLVPFSLLLIFIKNLKKILLFNQQVWLGLGISIFCVIAILNLIRRYLECRSTFRIGFRPNNEPQTGNLKTGGQHRAKKRQTGNEYLYVLGNLLSQGFCISLTLRCSRFNQSRSQIKVFLLLLF
jgi:hypothetical protein